MNNSFMNKVAQKKWAITLTLKPVIMSKLVCKEQYELALLSLITTRDREIFFDNMVIQFEMTKKYNIHVHILATLRKEVLQKDLKIILNGILNFDIWGFYYIKPIIDENGWISYINKNPFEYYKHFYAF